MTKRAAVICATLICPWALSACAASPQATHHTAQSPLPTGLHIYAAPAPALIAGQPPAPQQLDVTPIRQTVTLIRAPFPRAQMPQLVSNTVGPLVVPAVLRPLAVTEPDLRPGGQLAFAVTGLGASRHDALAVLSGPGYRGTRLLQIAGVDRDAGGIIHLPQRLGAGTWVLAVQDLSHVRLVGRTLTGYELVYAGVFTVHPAPGA